MADLLKRYWDWLPTEIQKYIMLFAFSQHRIDIQRRLQLNKLRKEFQTKSCVRPGTYHNDFVQQPHEDPWIICGP